MIASILMCVCSLLVTAVEAPKKQKEVLESLALGAE